MVQLKNECLFFIGVIPPKEIQEQIIDLKLEIKAKCGSSHAFNAPPHITLHMPFVLHAKKSPMLKAELQKIEFLKPQEKITIKNFNSFSPRVIYAAIEPNESLDYLQKQVAIHLRKLQIFNSNYKNQPFSPHITLAFRDFKKRDFTAIWPLFEHRQFEASFELNAIHLLRYQLKDWQVVETFSLNH